ncbi:competence type IV pilus assembly protein ComGB [Shouchella lonarensis]|uniref:Competence-related pilin export protein ComGB n=1 Tax=Shouchella lonarensis TaxID=1464122 RepID=A0A1G6GLY5_9BACI|nr:competence type IV pilus assembly protein ComGB [Shouchella lonarensis]SDB82987.1 competence-related pilin export protein ComGB [Shouchella lonarensis]
MRRRREKDMLETIRFLERLGRLLSQGYAMDAALAFLVVHSSARLKACIATIRAGLQDGQSFHDSVEVLALPKEIWSFIYFYEQQGTLDEGLLKTSQLALKRQQTTKQLQKLLRYPLLLVWGTVLVILVLNQLIVPHFSSLFATMNTDPPMMTQLFFAFMRYLPVALLCFVLVVGVVVLCFFLHFKKRSPHDQMSFLLKRKSLRPILQRVITYYFALQMGRLLQAGMTIKDALQLFEGQRQLQFLREEATYIRERLAQGEAIEAIIFERDCFMNELALVVENGTRTGSVARDLQHYSDWLYEEMDDRMQKGATWLQPLLLIFIGGFVFTLFLVVMLPMFEMIGAIE